MNAKPYAMGSDLNKINVRDASDEDYNELPELKDSDFERKDAKWRIAGKVVTEAEGKAAFSAAMKKQKINITIDPDILAWFKAQAGGRGYQTLINASLRESMRGQQIEGILRQVIREELHKN